MNKNIIGLLIGIIALLAGALAAVFFIKKKMDAEAEEFDEFEDFDMIDDDDEFFGEDEYAEYDALNVSSPDSIPYANAEESTEEETEGEL
ncbi:MAG: LPXTG cell wall anchor domain-containing protein [Ruminiclostridium sp.]|nr:LPXTG cell wall anchor domain-containing protein [Ruminiclostridium sp.]MBR4111744.1 LPXTG cell wall anchor domain-containing protein [Ruminiclostridium sp.]